MLQVFVCEKPLHFKTLQLYVHDSDLIISHYNFGVIVVSKLCSQDRILANLLPSLSCDS